MSQVPVSKDLATLGNEVLSAFRKASGETARLRDGSQPPPSCETACKTESQRFQLWSINLGLFQSSHKSLDYRLRQNETVRSFVAALLTDLCFALDDRKSSRPIIVGMRTQRLLVVYELSQDSKDDTRDLLAGIHAASESNIDAQSSQLANEGETSDSSSGNANEKTLMALYMEDVIEINDELMKVAMQIRSPEMRKPRHETGSHDEVDHDKDVYTKVLQSFRKKGVEQTLLSARRRILSIDQAGTSPVLRDSDEFLVDRLSKANDFRRQQFEYWKTYRSHSVRGTTNAAAVAGAEDAHDTPPPHSLSIPKAEVILVKSNQRACATVSMPSVTLLAPDFELRSIRSARTHQSRALTIHGPSGDLIFWPEVPPTVPIGKEFECPLCYFICPREQRSGEAWR